MFVIDSLEILNVVVPQNNYISQNKYSSRNGLTSEDLYFAHVEDWRVVEVDRDISFLSDITALELSAFTGRCDTHSNITISEISGGSKGVDARDARPLGGPNSFNFMQFLEKFGKIVCWLSLESRRPHLGEILDQPLEILWIYNF